MQLPGARAEHAPDLVALEAGSELGICGDLRLLREQAVAVDDGGGEVDELAVGGA